MKISAAAILVAAGSASAFAPASNSAARSSSLSMNDDEFRRAGVLDSEPTGFANQQQVPGNAGMVDEPPRKKAPMQSIALPFAKCPPLLNGEMAGDVGFDPLGFADSEANLINYREAEIKHGRLAMLAAAGWPLSELWDRGLAKMMGMDPLLDEAGRVPSVLNGGLGKVSLGYWGGCIAAAAVLDAYGSFAASKKPGYIPGDLGFDPLGMYPKDAKGKMRMQLSEIKHGRIAMVAITAFAFQEFAAGTPVVEHAAFFFKPIWQSLSEQVPGYYIPEEATTAAFEAAGSAASEAASATAAEIGSASEMASQMASEAASVAVPEVALPPPVVDVAPPAPVVDFAPPAPPAPPAAADLVAPAVEAVAPPPAPPSSEEQLAAANLKIQQLEAQLRAIQGVVQ